MTKNNYLVRKIDKGGKAHPYSTLSIAGVIQLLNMASAGVCKFEIEKI